MRAICFSMALTLSVNGFLMSTAQAAPSYTFEKLMHVPATGSCHSYKSVYAREGALIRPSTWYTCAIDTVAIPIPDISRATAYVRLRAPKEPASVELCYRSMVSGTTICGQAAYAYDTGGIIMGLSATPPKGEFDSNHVAFLRVYLPASKSDYSYFYSYKLSKKIDY